MSERILDAFRTQADYCRAGGSALTAQVLEALQVVTDHSTRTGSRILDWPGDPMADALMLRITGGLNALARTGKNAQLTRLYAERAGDFTGIISRALQTYDDWLYPWLDGPPQTNEVARSAVLWPGMMEIARRFGPKLEILELGSSAGLNLNLDRFGYDLGGLRSGDPDSVVQLAPRWLGAPPAVAPVEIVARRGVDLHPLNVADQAVRARLLAYIWPDQPDRVARATAALAIADAFPPPVDQGEAAAWVDAQVAESQATGVTRVVFHSVAFQYFSSESQTQVTSAIVSAGKRASPAHPLAWLSMEFVTSVKEAVLQLRCWPGSGEAEVLARSHPHGAEVSWLVV